MLRGTVNDPFDQPFFFQFTDSNTSETSIDFESFNEDRNANKPEGGNFLVNSVIRGLINSDGVLGLVLDLSLRPFLLLCFTTPT